MTNLVRMTKKTVSIVPSSMTDWTGMKRSGKASKGKFAKGYGKMRQEVVLHTFPHMSMTGQMVQKHMTECDGIWRLDSRVGLIGGFLTSPEYDHSKGQTRWLEK